MSYLDELQQDKQIDEDTVKRGISHRAFNFYLAAIK